MVMILKVYRVELTLLSSNVNIKSDILNGVLNKKINYNLFIFIQTLSSLTLQKVILIKNIFHLQYNDKFLVLFLILVLNFSDHANKSSLMIQNIIAINTVQNSAMCHTYKLKA